MKKFRKLAVFGGTFSPVHNGHLCALRAFYETVKPDVLYMIPTGQPPHKTRYDSATDRQRLDMLSLAAKTLKPEYNVVVSDIEIRRGGKSYTVDTGAELLQAAGSVSVYCGTDMFLTLEQWHRFEELLRMAQIAYMCRREDLRLAATAREKAAYFRKVYGADIVEIPDVPVEASSSEIRAMVRAGEDVSTLLPAAVAGYIEMQGLYR